ncbi:MAG: T9SS type A sorting domain-containing protein, partial [candidate division Zixibacteria bacterium]|nr:T9SS type A sorting domain-containing protein [candidate division Zixibacteria bacterium]
YDTSMTPVTPEHRVNTDNLKTAQREPTIAADRMGNVAIIWADSTTSSWDINGQMIDVDGLVREENFRANTFGDSLQLHPDVALDGRYRYVTWADRRNGNFDVYASITRYNDPTLVVAPASLKFSMERGTSPPPAQTVVVEHTGYNGLGYRVDVAGDFITVSPAAGRTPDTVAVAIATDTLAFGTYLGWLTVVDTVNHDSSARVSVRLDVTAPVMVVDPDTLYCRAFAVIDEDYCEPIVLTNSGTGQYSWTASEQADWIELSSYTGFSPDSIDAVVNAAGLSAGHYVEPVVLESDAASGSPDTVWVALEVVDNLPYLQVEPDSIFIRADVEAVVDTSVVVLNPGVGILAWQANTADPWLVLDRISGFAGDTVNIAIDPAGLPTGAHFGYVDFVASGSFNVTKRLPVVLDLYEQSTDTVIFEPANTRILEPGVMSIRLNLKRASGRVYLPFRYDASLLSGDSVVFGPGLPTFMECTGVLDGEAGRISLVVDQAQADSFLAAGSYLLADFYFTAGDSAATVSVDTLLLDTLSAHVVSSDGRKLAPAIIPGEITIGAATAVDESSDNGLPSRFGLSQNYPNPFNLATVIEFGLPRKSRIELEIFNILGQLVKTLKAGPSSAGYHRVVWDGHFDDGRTAPSGIYFYRLLSDEVSLVHKMVLVK